MLQAPQMLAASFGGHVLARVGATPGENERFSLQHCMGVRGISSSFRWTLRKRLRKQLRRRYEHVNLRWHAGRSYKDLPGLDFRFRWSCRFFLRRSLKNTCFQRGSCTFEDGNIVWGSGEKSSFISCRTLRGATEAQIRHKTSQNFINLFFLIVFLYF